MGIAQKIGIFIAGAAVGVAGTKALDSGPRHEPSDTSALSTTYFRDPSVALLSGESLSDYSAGKVRAMADKLGLTRDVTENRVSTLREAIALSGDRAKLSESQADSLVSKALDSTETVDPRILAEFIVINSNYNGR